MSRVDAATGSLLEMLTRSTNARRVLEIGTGCGEAALSIVKALPADGMLITLERDEVSARRARAACAEAGVSARVTVMIGDAARYLHKISGPFDLVVQHIDADQREGLRSRLLQLLRTGGLLVTTSLDSQDGEIALLIKR